jgi:L-threonylcarbamoyladenylate synthase
MRIVVDPSAPDPEVLRKAVAVLRASGLVAVPTETVYGLGALGTDPLALARVFEAKGRPTTHALILHVLDLDAARPLVARVPALAERLAAAFWPGPLTMVLPRSARVPDAVTGGGPTVAIRAPSHPVVRALLHLLDAPLAAPSANRYQSVSPTRAIHVERSLGAAVDLVLDAGPCERGIESTVVDLTGPVPRILRLGAVSAEDLRAVVGELEVHVHAVEPGVAHASPGLDARHYAPRGRIVFAEESEGVVAMAEVALRADPGAKIALLVRRPPVAASRPTGCSLRILGDDPVIYARNLYDALHDADEQGATLLIVEQVPHLPAWAAVRDRLSRASNINET